MCSRCAPAALARCEGGGALLQPRAEHTRTKARNGSVAERETVCTGCHVVCCTRLAPANKLDVAVVVVVVVAAAVVAAAALRLEG